LNFRLLLVSLRGLLFTFLLLN